MKKKEVINKGFLMAEELTKLGYDPSLYTKKLEMLKDWRAKEVLLEIIDFMLTDLARARSPKVIKALQEGRAIHYSDFPTYKEMEKFKDELKKEWGF
ncbi:hypothetical protein CON15_19780 [Bacillus cereus]|uniref:Uncharacterized protein n=1 Tax=Bacillus thuringiensis TaxID=1428 RepID=A0A9X6U5H7_BACTU|nr:MULTISPECIES: hypothetical protein [Bacillus cereus group]PDZ55783.1 hypothetical protein CON15_19780 [Bacillus cereus]PED16448.1 hypothetical protein CON01_00940 [Bacillus thuringiensis]PFC28556.1 hypothetical protein CN299_20000 [Bacillus thuringiensis]PFO26141.1 hypothetical protein COJ78_28995 [Bacillus thuringiensis]PFS40403.1 hypothetical protein COK48_00735 [Bacillus thuringiensis]